MSSSKAFSQVLLLHWRHITEHRSPLFRQPHAARQPFLHLQDMSFKSCGGAGGIEVVTGDKPACVLFQPQSSAFNSFPCQSCTWWYVRYECCSAAASVGGKFAMLCLLLYAVLIKVLCLNAFKAEFPALQPYKRSRNWLPAFAMACGSAFGLRKSLTDGSKSGLLINTLINFLLPFPNPTTYFALMRSNGYTYTAGKKRAPKDNTRESTELPMFVARLPRCVSDRNFDDAQAPLSLICQKSI